MDYTNRDIINQYRLRAPQFREGDLPAKQPHFLVGIAFMILLGVLFALIATGTAAIL